MVTTMAAFETPAVLAKSFSRRRALWLAGAAGLGAAVSACGESGGAGAESTAGSPGTSAPPVASTPTSSPPAPAAPTIPATMLCRESWGALPPLPGGRPHSITRMTIHHTAVYLGDNANAPARLRQHQTFHQGQRGWIDIAYHISVDRNGNIYQLRAPEIAGDTATNYDPTGHFLVLCEGNFDEEQISEAQLHGAALVLAWAADHYAISTETLAGHRDASPDTACPGEHLYSQLTSLKQRVDDLRASGGVDLHVICGPEADAVVAAIEAGVQPPPH